MSIELGHATDRKPPFKYAAFTRVGFSDTDAQGIVYYGRYLPYFDQARVEYHRHLDLLGEAMGEEQFVMRASSVEYFAPAQFDDVLSGITYGWLNNNCALTAQVHVGSGQMLLTTYRFHRYGADPYTTELLNAFLSYVAGVEMLPRLKLRTEISADSRELVNTSIPRLDK